VYSNSRQKTGRQITCLVIAICVVSRIDNDTVAQISTTQRRTQLTAVSNCESAARNTSCTCKGPKHAVQARLCTLCIRGRPPFPHLQSESLAGCEVLEAHDADAVCGVNLVVVSRVCTGGKGGGAGATKNTRSAARHVGHSGLMRMAASFAPLFEQNQRCLGATTEFTR
jgi:hypothetical protein